jgi:thioredoxin-related protein
MRIIIITVLFIPHFVNAQMPISFYDFRSWNELTKEAKKEKKFIFIDCFATWCGPCKLMDRQVYTDSSVGSYFNSNFISVKLQLDTSGSDNIQVKKLYSEAKLIKDKYDVDVFPTYLFFDPNGEIVHKGFGAMDVASFISLGKDARNPRRQFFTMKRAYINGSRKYEIMRDLALTAKKLKYEKFSEEIANEFVMNYLTKVKDTILYSRNNILFIAEFNRYSEVLAKKMFYFNALRVDSVMGKVGYSRSIILNKIYKDIYLPACLMADKNGKAPSWEAIAKKVEYQYDIEYAEISEINAKFVWYAYKKNWPEHCRYAILKVEKNFPDTLKDELSDYWRNDIAWTSIFLHSIDTVQLQKAASWMREVVARNMTDVAYIDTYANLLYKLKRTEEAIAWETKALRLDPKSNEFKQNILNMKQGIPTWE